ncbi:carboxypeptidase regulatory-like domain-containing protein [Sorangium sp. So ce375]|uniref:carboxypeptidase regulatory-like domain-containing protein n=1 Tax=Sorangium sp. So ce375 TaxID=3133306 RepID=UPI003F5B24D2
MGGFLRIKPAVHRVAIAGKVIDALTSQPIAGAIASITASPGAFQRALAIHAQQRRAREDDATARPDRAVAAADGCFCFADLPDGAYTVSIAAPAGLRYGVVARAFTVKRDAEGNIAASIVAIPLPPTGARGLVKASDTSLPLPLARVRVEGGAETAYCDAAGRFVVSGVQEGARRLSISASGYRRDAIAAQISPGQIVDVGIILLQPAGA